MSIAQQAKAARRRARIDSRYCASKRRKREFRGHKKQAPKKKIA